MNNQVSTENDDNDEQEYQELTSDQVLRRIEDTILGIVEEIQNDSMPVIQNNGVTKRFTPSQSRSFASTTMVLAYCHSLLRTRRTNTTREVYYAYVTHFRSQRECDAVIQDIVRLLNVPRRSLGLKASPKGWFCGDIQITKQGERLDATILHSSQGVPIGNEWLLINKEFTMTTKGARCLLIIEKEGIYDRLCQERFFDQYPCIIATGKGFPDLATRAFAHAIHHEFKIPVFGVCDLNPYGVLVLNTYLRGSDRRGVDGGERFSVPIGWIGLRPSQMKKLAPKLPPQAFQRMTLRDIKRIDDTLLSDTHPWIRSNDSEARVAEILEMKRLGYKVELEALSWIDVDYCSKLLHEILSAYEDEQDEDDSLYII